MTVLDDRLALLDNLTLRSGGHPDFNAGVCAMEAAAWLAGEEHSDRPQCVSAAIGAFLRNWNDSLRTDEERNRLIRPLLPLVIGTKTTKRDEERRAWLATDWLVREQAPAWLRLAGLADHAHALEDLAALRGRASAVKAQPKIAAAGAAARDAAGAATWAAAWDAAGAAAWDAARDAARAAAWAAAWDAARDAAGAATWAAARDAGGAPAAAPAAGAAAWAAARAAAWDAARDAARAATWAAARDALEPTVQILQSSAALLVKRMAEVGR